MNKIQILPDNLANQIAAGEVVERPASVIKELVENSLDAGATRIQVDVELGGRRLIRISDDGEGMTRDDAVLAFERHATSKIRTQDDLARIGTLGFRGEALASIASVARVELITKREPDLAATRALVEGGRLIDVNDAARNVGTTVTVRDLFFNTPARRKFMRSEATENYHLTSIVTHYALAHPEVGITLTNNGREVLRLSSARDLRERAFQIFGGGLLESLIPLNGGREYIAKISGFVSAPRERRTTRDGQYFFVNKRFVRDKTIAGGLLEGYRSILPHGVYPVAFLFVDIPLEEIDVNVHPAKTEIRFRRGEAVKDVISEAVRSALANAGITGDVPTTVPFANGAAAIEPSNRSFEEPPAHAPDRTNGLSEPLANALPNIDVSKYEKFEHSVQSDIPLETVISTLPLQPVEPEPVISKSTFSDSRAPEMPPLDSAAKIPKPAGIETVSGTRIECFGQLHESFIIAADDEGLLLIDQHVAHERILFDKYLQSETARPIESQNLLLPETIDLTPAQSQAFELIENDLENLGFGLMRLSGRTVAIKSIPTDVAPGDARNLFAELLDAIDLDKRSGPKSAFRDGIAASLACRAAIKINMKLTSEKMHWLVDGLLRTTSPTTCPHGRPVILRLSMKDIERGFQRT
jgi:DNA mismatch repair protein MutL